MRSDRRKAIAAQLEEEKKAEKKKHNGFFRVIAVLYTILAVAFVVLLCKLNVLPAKYLYPGIGILALVTLFTVPVMFSKKGKQGRRIVAAVVAFALMGVFGTGTWYMADTLDFLDKITNVTNVVKEKFYVVVEEASPLEEVKALDGKSLGTFISEDIVYSEAKANLQKEVAVEYAYEETYEALFDKLRNKEYEAVFLSSATYENYGKDHAEIVKGTRILYTVEVPIEKEASTSAVDVNKESFNVYIGGLDYNGKIGSVGRTDVNMIATVNPLTHKVLLTSIPRDYYITLPTKDAKDKLTHAGNYGVHETIGALEDVLGIDINYYLRVNYTTAVKLVDAIGGIQVNSDHDFTTSGMQSLSGHHFVKGINQLDGKAALAFSRERHSFLDGDMQRNLNQQLVMKAILEKVSSSTTILTSYTGILDAVKDNMETNMSGEDMTSIVKAQLKDMPKWDIERQAIRGNVGLELCYALGMKASVVLQIPEENAHATDTIVKIMTEKP